MDHFTFYESRETGGRAAQNLGNLRGDGVERGPGGGPDRLDALLAGIKWNPLNNLTALTLLWPPACERSAGSAEKMWRHLVEKLEIAANADCSILDSFQILAIAHSVLAIYSSPPVHPRGKISSNKRVQHFNASAPADVSVRWSQTARVSVYFRSPLMTDDSDADSSDEISQAVLT